MLLDNANEAANRIQKGLQLFAECNLDGAEECFTEALSSLHALISQTLFSLGKIAFSRLELALQRYLSIMNYGNYRCRDSDT
jgi:hypothetical protein